MFFIRMSTTNSADDSCYDIDLPQVPAVGDTIQIDLEETQTVYRILARRFDIAFRHAEQLTPERPQVLLHVVEE
jgi:hypothetical protein